MVHYGLCVNYAHAFLFYTLGKIMNLCVNSHMTECDKCLLKICNKLFLKPEKCICSQKYFYL